MSDRKTFFTFPICLLALSVEEKEILQHICSYGLSRAGASNGAIGAKEIKNHVAEHGQRTTGYDRSLVHDELVRGAIVCNVDLGHIPSTLKRVATARNFISEHERSHGADPLVFVSTTLFWGCHNSDDPPYRDFSTLCAINSVIGFKSYPILVRRGMIQARQLGYKTPAVMEAELKKRDDQKPLTIQQLRDTLDRLESRELIHRCQASPRRVYFSTTLSDDALRTAVAGVRATWSKVQSRREADRGQWRTKQEPSENRLKRKPAIGAKKEPLKNGEPHGNHIGTSQEPHGEPHREPHGEPLKEMPSNKSLLNKSLQINGGECPPVLTATERITRENELEEIREAIKKINKTHYKLWTDDKRAKLNQFIDREEQLLGLLGISPLLASQRPKKPHAVTKPEPANVVTLDQSQEISAHG